MVTRVKGGTAPNAAEIDMEDGRTVPEAIGEVQTNLDIHASLTSPHGATPAATANSIILRDAAGRARVAAPSGGADIANKNYVDATAARQIGWNQTWQNMTARRTAGVTYTNSTGRPIVANVTYGGTTSNSTTAIVATVDGITMQIALNTNSGGGVGAAGHVIIPSGSTYSFNVADTWWELR